MESLAYMILTLPHALGGYGLKGAVFNYEILLKSKAEHLTQNRFYTDLYYKEAKLAVEYESFAYHSCPSEQSKDMLRSTRLERQGIVVMRLSTIQLYNKGACNASWLGMLQRKSVLAHSTYFLLAHASLGITTRH